MRVKRMVSAGLVAMALVAGLVGCGDSDDVETVGGGADIVARSDPKPHFDPKELKAALNSEVILTVKNEGDVTHNFTISFLGVDEDIPPGQSKQVRFRVTPPPHNEDFYTFYDETYQGEGMQGRINVE
jgi:cupredoxin-like protein